MRLHFKNYILILALMLPASAQAGEYFDAEPINYNKSSANNAVSRMMDGIENGTIQLEYDADTGYLKALLDYLDIPVESQVLVFSKTSLQSHYISPSTPRAIYFNDDTYVGTVPYGDLIEISTSDPQLGAVFYSLPQEKLERPELSRENQRCLQCHASTNTNGFPGHIVRSVFTDENGLPIFNAGSHLTTQASPFEERWGGWYVTGTHGDARHMGNVLANRTDFGAEIDMEAGANRTELDERVFREHYLTPHSDIVALMVLEHQAQMHNLITEANYAARRALHNETELDKMLEDDAEGLRESTRRRIADAGDKLVDHMLFVDEAPLKNPVHGTSGFAEGFSKAGPKDNQGRSLRTFNLKRRIFEYPLSYLIYSPQFDGLPDPMKDYIYQRLWDILTHEIYSRKYHHLSNAKCLAIRQILSETKEDLPAYWHGRRHPTAD